MGASATAADLDVSILMPFADDEERVGRAVRRVAEHAGALGHAGSFEILCADEGAGDNSVALLGWLARHELPALRLVAAEPGRGYAAAVAAARGRVLWFLDVESAAGAPLAPLGRAHDRVAGGAADLVFAPGPRGARFALARRARVWPVACEVRGRGQAFARRLRRKALLADLRVEEGGAAYARRADVWRAVLATYLPGF